MKKIIIFLITIIITFGFNKSRAQYLWGMAASQNSNNIGSNIFKINEDGTNFQAVHVFDSATGYIAIGTLLFANNKFYGLTCYGGSHDDGVIFSYDSTTYTYTDLYDFTGIDGKNPNGSLIKVNNGLLYGMTNQGGTTNDGVIFSYNIITNTLTDLYNFDGTHGKRPDGNLFLASNGCFYGMTYSGGLYNAGVAFKYDTSSHAYTDIHDFHNPSDGHQPYGSLMQASNGLIYGMTSLGGGGTSTGILFSINPIINDTFILVHNFIISTGDQPHGSLIQASNGLLYGMTYVGGINNEGVIFSFNTSNNVYADLAAFNNTINGSGPQGDLLEGRNGKLYGLVTFGGSGGSEGTIISFDTNTNIVTNMHTFTGSDGSEPWGNLIEPPSCIIPVLLTNNNQNLCVGSSITLTVSGASSYSWQTNNSTDSAITVSPISTTTYIVTGSNGGCSKTDSITVTVLPSPTPVITPNGPTTFCQGGSVLLTTGSFATYLWNNGITTQSINATASGNYSITVTNSGGCTGIASETVSVTANPVPVIAPTSPINLCEGENVTLHASNGILYNWSNGATTQYLDVSTSGTYSVTVTYGVNCSNTSAPTDVIVHPLPLATIAALPENLEFCIGDSILLTANSSTSPITYLWNQGSTTQSIEATQSGDFTVIVTDTIGCHSSSSINLTSYLYPVANFTYSIFLNTTTFTNTSTNGTAYQWYFGDGNVSTLMNPTHTYSHDSTYTITLIVTNPCGADTVRYTITLTGINEINVSNSFYIFPNPANNQVKISFSSDREESYNVRLIDVTGRTIITDNQIAVSGDDHYLMDVSTIARGVYIVSLQKRDAVLKSKLVIQ